MKVSMKWLMVIPTKILSTMRPKLKLIQIWNNKPLEPRNKFHHSQLSTLARTNHSEEDINKKKNKVQTERVSKAAFKNELVLNKN